jgi:hypothetical protein
VNKKLLAFKKSKDIHGREALFEDVDIKLSALESLIENNLLNKSILSNRTSAEISSVTEVESSDTNNTLVSSKPLLTDIFVNSEINFQIVLTTSPSNASYELSFKYNLNDGQFHFNRNEISRINNYNTSANCMLEKRPDLRQFCFCK